MQGSSRRPDGTVGCLYAWVAAAGATALMRCARHPMPRLRLWVLLLVP